MSKINIRWGWFLRIAICSASVCSTTNCAFAQITPDGTLPNNSIVTPDGITLNLTGGTQAGSNLFHSFEEFSVPINGVVLFKNSVNIQNIISRVTGGSVSNINGLIRTNGTANLFLLNPNGIIFGPNASLDIKGSFVASTATSLKFADGIEFSATNSQTTPLLTVSVPIGLQLGSNPGSILNQSQAINSDRNGEIVGLQVEPSKTLALVGGDIALEGGYLTAAGGRIELGGVAGLGFVNLNSTNSGWVLGYDGVQNFRDIKLSQRAVVDASGSGGGDIQVQGRQVTVTDGSQIVAKTLGTGLGGALSINASDFVQVSGESANPQDFSRLTTRTEGSGDAGNLTIITSKFIVQKGAQVSTGTRPRSTGNGGNLIINALDSVAVSGESVDGGVNSRLTTRTEGGGDAGNLTITTGKLIIQAGGQISAGTLANSQGNGGNLTVNASDSVAVSGESVDGEVNSRLTTRTEGGGDAGALTITTGKLIIQAGGEVSAGTLAYSEGNGGNLTVNASDLVEVSGKSVNGGVNSRLTVRTGNSKNAGGMTINTGKLIIQAGGEVSAGTRGGSEGSGGSLIVNASDSVNVNGLSTDSQDSSRLTTRTEGGGDAGALTINTRKLMIQAGGQVSASTVFGSTGAGGSLTVNASDSVEVMGFTTKREDTILSRLTTRTEGGGNADNLTINTKKLIIRDGGQVSAGTVLNSTGNGGNLTVNASESVEVSKEVVGIPGGSVKSRLTNRTENNQSTGNLRITTGKLIVQDQAEVGVNSNFGSGKPGNLEVVARSILLDNQATLNARAASVDGGNIILQVQDILLLRRKSQISATAGIAGARGNGGNITINVPNGFIVALPNENSDIAANAFTGTGGRVDITAQSIFGLTPRSREELQTLFGTNDPNKLNPARLSSSDIIAISRTNPSLNGQVRINTPDDNSSRTFINLPARSITTQLAQGCQAGGTAAKSQFMITGRGGLPPNPGEALNNDALQVGLITLNPSNDNRDRSFVASKITITTPERIVEATGLALNEKGEVVLTANLPTTTPHSPWLKPVPCRAIPNS